MFATLRSLRSRWQDRMDRWLLARVPGKAHSVEVARNRIYIIPTRYGYGYGCIGVVLLLGAMNYANSMAFALAFLMAGVGLVAMYHTHSNLLNLRVSAQPTEPAFAGGDARLQLRLENPSVTTRWSVGTGLPRKQPQQYIDAVANDTTTATLLLPAPVRGRYPVGPLCLSSEFPLGLLHAWTWVAPTASILVYPRPEGDRPLPSEGVGSGDGSTSGEREGQDEFHGLRNYRGGDPLSRIHWKRYTQTGELSVKQFMDTRDHRCWLDFEQLGSLALEARLSQLTRWVLDADSAGLAYGLRLPGLDLSPDQGPVHRHACLQALALYPAEGLRA